MTHVFISHSNTDNAITEALADHLQQAGINIWIDRKNIKSGDRWLRSIQKALEACHAVVIVMSRAARDSEWVEREALLAMDLRKPIYIARIEDMPLPLYLINRQYTDFVQDADRAREDLIDALLALDDGAAPRRLPASRSPLPNQQNFFEYVAQLPGGESNEWIARDLFRWGQSLADAVEFGGKITPGFHVRVHIGEDDVTVFSLWAFARQPAVQVQLQYLSEFPPYDNRKVRLSTLRSLNRLMDEPFLDDRADRRPTLPLQEALDTADKLETFKQIISEIIDNLRGN
jgi:hypothetical protein